MRVLKSILILFIFILIWQLEPAICTASNTNGIIDENFKYAWGENVGWLNFGTNNGGVHITDSSLSGYALGENIGWVYLDDILNDGEGNLSGFAWGENTGWIKFNPINGGVVINSSGEFTGSALSENVGWIIFGGDYKVKTDWRPISARPACNNSIDDDGDSKIDYPDDSGCESLEDNDEKNKLFSSGSVISNFFNKNKKEYNFLIKNGDKYTNNKNVVLSLNGGYENQKISVSNAISFSGIMEEDYQDEKNWDLCQEPSDFNCLDGMHKVYVKFYNFDGTTQIISNDIILDTNKPEIQILNIKDLYSSSKNVILQIQTEAGAEIVLHWDKKYGLINAEGDGKQTINLGKLPIGNYQIEMTPTDLAGNKGEIKIVSLVVKPEGEVPKEEENIKVNEQTSFIDELIPDFLKPKEEQEAIKEMVIIPENAPLAMNGKWGLMAHESIRSFVFAPLPNEILKLANKFPEFSETLKKVGINKLSDVEKLIGVNLTLPGLNERIQLLNTKLGLNKFQNLDGLPLAKLTTDVKKQIPSEIIFANTGGELVDFNIGLSIDDKGNPEQKITTIVGKPLELVVRPDSPVKSVKGYVVFKSKTPKENLIGFQLNQLSLSRLFASPILAFPQQKPVEIENRLVLLEFEYTDPDGDGLYTAQIESSLVEGEYEIITVLEFEDAKLGKREIRLITVVDPEGYVYTSSKLGKIRIAEVIVSIYWLNPETKEYELWQAEEYQQENPQTTNDTGKYSFLVPPGKYYLKTERSNYNSYQSEIFTVKDGSGVHMNIELKAKFWWFKIVDWKTIVIIVFGILLFYNFYKDRRRDKLLKN